MRYRKLDADGDMTFGQQQANFWRDVPDAPAQAILTRLKMFAGEWYLDISEGVPYQGGVLGKYTKDSADSILRNVILNTPGVAAILSYESSFEPNTRVFSVHGIVSTIYGEATFNGVV
ncbi:hypothetical protein D3C76_163630 [compost metagenome]